MYVNSGPWVFRKELGSIFWEINVFSLWTLNENFAYEAPLNQFASSTTSSCLFYSCILRALWFGLYSHVRPAQKINFWSSGSNPWKLPPSQGSSSILLNIWRWRLKQRKLSAKLNEKAEKTKLSPSMTSLLIRLRPSFQSLCPSTAWTEALGTLLHCLSSSQALSAASSRGVLTQKCFHNILGFTPDESADNTLGLSS